ncbi:uncharacterized protein LOC114530615 isoform X2 [Dendronephthya gigantea]|nr:uncharacterized protein LOC114530615 isoform X2 [Dendronephthya gigantea]
MDQDYYDKYGAPTNKDHSWEEGYHVVERKLYGYYDVVGKDDMDFPFIAGVGGGAHLYKPIHDHEPWNWTGWVPLQKEWCCQGKFFRNRYFLALRGNEIQNNLWDYHPYEEEIEDRDDMEYSQVEPNDRYRGGYWYQRQPFGRYLHIIALKSHEEKCTRYNYIVHPLAYRAAIHTIPDNSVDAMQWCIINMPEEQHFGKDQPWGEKCHGLEIFNDFTYYHSYQAIEDGGPSNGELTNDPKHMINGENKYYYWFDTYPLEFAVFLLDSALARGVYFHTMAANDAFYERSNTKDETDGTKPSQGSEHLHSDPKGGLHKHNRKHAPAWKDARLGVQSHPHPEEKDKSPNSFDALPYKEKFVFGYVTLIDPSLHLKETVFQKSDGKNHQRLAEGEKNHQRLDEGEKVVLDYLIKGRHYGTTGVWDLFKYENSQTDLPFTIENQPNQEELCYDMTENMKLEFTFLPCKKRNVDLVWRYTIMVEFLDGSYVKGLETTHGYFKLDENHPTTLDLRSSYDISHVKWLYFTAITPSNPQRRAWLHAIRGPAFGSQNLHSRLPPLKHTVVPTVRDEDIVTQGKPITPTAVNPKGDLDFAIGKATNENDIYVYSMQVCPLQQDLLTEPVSEKIRESSDLIPPRILQSVHGYFYLRNDFSTRLNLTGSWDKETVKDNVNFYIIDGKTGQPKPMDIKVKAFGKKKKITLK